MVSVGIINMKERNMKRMNQINKIIRVCFIMITIVMASCDTQQLTTPVATQIYTTQFENFNSVIDHVGYVTFREDYYLSFPTSGRIIEMNVQEGDAIVSGDVIASLDATSFHADIARAEADLALAQANLDKSQAGPHPALIEEAESEVDLAAAVRPVGMAQATAQAINVEVAQARLDYLQALPLPEDVALAQAEVDRREKDLEAAWARLSQTILVSPIDGTILDVLVQMHGYANTGQPVVRLSNLEILRIEFVVDDLEVAGINLGDEAVITFDALPGIETTGEVVIIRPESWDNLSGKYIVTLSLSDQPETILLGMRANVRFLEE
jgi:multidrug efflux pump subunit AcrA (membrane-fusion protein)